MTQYCSILHVDLIDMGMQIAGMLEGETIRCASSKLKGWQNLSPPVPGWNRVRTIGEASGTPGNPGSGIPSV